MKHIGFLAGLAGVAAMAALAVPAAASSFDVTAQPVLSTNASGTYDIVFSSVDGTNWSITVKGNNDGNVVAPPGGEVKHSVDQITVTFLGDSPVSASGGTTTGGPYTAGIWTTTLSGNSQFNGPAGGASDVGPFGENMFNGTVSLASMFNSGTVKFALQDNGQQWNVNTGLTPEAGSLALILPGLMPLGLLLRKRSRRDRTAA